MIADVTIEGGIVSEVALMTIHFTSPIASIDRFVAEFLPQEFFLVPLAAAKNSPSWFTPMTLTLPVYKQKIEEAAEKYVV